MIKTGNIRSASDFVRNMKLRIREMKKTGEPQVLTVNGQAELVVLTPAAYQKLADSAEMEEDLAVIRKGLQEAERGEGTPAAELIRRLRVRNNKRKSA